VPQRRALKVLIFFSVLSCRYRLAYFQLEKIAMPICALSHGDRLLGRRLGGGGVFNVKAAEVLRYRAGRATGVDKSE
jgi:hypothetical protein